MTALPAPALATSAAAAALVVLALAVPAEPAGAAQTPVRDQIAAIRFPELRFTPPDADSFAVNGVPVYLAEDSQLPLVTVYATFKGGPSRFPRTRLAAASAMPALLRTGGTAGLAPDSVDDRIELMALSMGFGQSGGSTTAWVNTLSDHVEEAVSLFAQMLREPRFDSSQVALWRGAELERVRRRNDDLGSVAYARFNQLMYGDHPVGWQMRPTDLQPSALTTDKLRFVHEAVVCPENMAIGIAGDLTRDRARQLLDPMLDGWPPCSGNLEEEPAPDIRRSGGVFVLHKESEQSVVLMAHSSSVRREDSPKYFASRIGHSVLGASGLSSRLSSLLRTSRGLTYSASSIWTAPARYDGLVGGLTRTKPSSTLAAARLLLAAMDSVRSAPPGEHEVALAVDEIANGFVFNFQTSFQIVARQIAYRNLGLPADWLERYLAGVRRVTPEDVLQVFEETVDPARMTILLVGDTTRFDGRPEELGPVTALPWFPNERPQSRP